MNLAHDEQFIIGVGYADGWARNTTKPLLWKYWSHEERMLYQKACMYGVYCKFKQDSENLVKKNLAIWRAICLLGSE